MLVQTKASLLHHENSEIAGMWHIFTIHGKSLPITCSYPELLQIEAFHCIRGKLEFNQGSDLGLLAFRDYILL